ncbi:MAG: shikimate dehydrogenase [Microthrixaceae bacterium]
MVTISGATKAAGVIGTPVRHSLSPVIFNAAFAASGLDWTYLAFEVPEGAAGLAMGGMRALGIEGVSVTMPHKSAVVEALDEVTADVAALGAANCVQRRGTELIGHNTDGPGLLDALRLDEGIDIEGKRFAVVGAGGAARAVIRALGRGGAASVLVVNRSVGPAEEAARLAGAVGRVGAAAEVRDTDVVINATPLGMGIVVTTTGDPEPLPVDPALLGEGQVVVDLVYHPAVTPLLAEARSRGVRTVNGLGMLIHQAAHAFRLWTGEEPPLEVMSAAAVAALLHRQESR